jgi:polyisoprenoid-binding protein YceI
MKNLVLALSLASLSGAVSAETFVVAGGASSGDTVKFESEAKLEFIQGATTDISGSIHIDPARTADSIIGRLQVDLRTLNTDIEMRDEHMRTRHLHTDQYPYAYFELTAVMGLPGELAAGVVCSCSAEGYFYIHGVKRKITSSLEIVDNSSGEVKSLGVHARFSLKLDDWKIPRPKALFLKLAETIEVDVRFTARTGKQALVFDLPDWSDK